MSMPHTPFLVAAYVLTLVPLVGMLVWSVRRMRRAERAIDGER
jgi:heme exporter protein CcmD